MNEICCACGREMVGYRRRDCVCDECRAKMHPTKELGDEGKLESPEGDKCG